MSHIAVDFDRTLTDPNEDEWAPAHKREANCDVVEAVREAYFDGNQIIIWTARQWTEAPQIVGWLHAHEVPYHGLKCAKGGADQYIEDKAASPEQFAQMWGEK
jgi:hydroxymethylpyrimidine pyrophosphatase-like HAD family hydrolase